MQKKTIMNFVQLSQNKFKIQMILKSTYSQFFLATCFLNVNDISNHKWITTTTLKK